MGAKGRDFLIQIETTTPGIYATVGGIRTNSLSINNEQVDITDKDGDGWKTLLEGAGLQSIALKGSGVSKTSTTLAQIRAAAFTNSFVKLKIVSGLGWFVTGSFQVSSFESAGDHNKEETFSAGFDSTGTVVYDDGA